MKVAEIHACEGCGAEARVEPGKAPDQWTDVPLLAGRLALCRVCQTVLASDPDGIGQAVTQALRGLLASPSTGDEVVLLVDGCRGKFKGRRGVVAGPSAFGDWTIRVPGEVAPGEKDEYSGPYSRGQFRLLPRPS